MRCPDCHAPLYECDGGLYCGKCSWSSFVVENQPPPPKHRRLPIIRLVRRKRRKPAKADIYPEGV